MNCRCQGEMQVFVLRLSTRASLCQAGCAPVWNLLSPIGLQVPEQPLPFLSLVLFLTYFVTFCFLFRFHNFNLCFCFLCFVSFS